MKKEEDRGRSRMKTRTGFFFVDYKKATYDALRETLTNLGVPTHLT